MEHRGLNTEFTRDPHEAVRDFTAKKYDLDAILSLDLIRSHTKTDDVPSVTNELLSLYRKQAISAAQRYTGLLLSERKVITQSVKTPNAVTYGRRTYGLHGGRIQPTDFKVTLEAPAASDFVWYFGLKNQKPEQVPVAPGATEVLLPRRHDDFGMGCCDPCGGVDLAQIMYEAGFACEEDIPVEFAMGALKYIAHIIENPGDNVVAVTVDGRSSGNSVDLAVANDPAVASGALNIWRTMVPDAV